MGDKTYISDIDVLTIFEFTEFFKKKVRYHLLYWLLFLYGLQKYNNQFLQEF